MAYVTRREFLPLAGIMGGPSTCKLNDPVADIGLNDLDAVPGEKGGKPDLFGEVGFRFDNEPLLSDLFQEDGAGIFATFRPKDLELVLLEMGDRLLKEIRVSQGLRANPLHLFLRLFKIVEEMEILLLTGPGLPEGPPLILQLGFFDLLS